MANLGNSKGRIMVTTAVAVVALVSVAVIGSLPFSISSAQNVTGDDTISNNVTSTLMTADNNTTTNTSMVNNYTTFENPELGISIQYPSDWTKIEQVVQDQVIVISFVSPLEEGSGDGNDTIGTANSSEAAVGLGDSRGNSNNNNSSLTGDNFAETVTIAVERLPNETITLDQYFNQSIQLLEEAFPNITFEGSAEPFVLNATTGNNIPALKQEYTTNQPIITQDQQQQQILQLNLRTMQIFTINEDMAYVITFVAEEQNYADYLPIVENMIDSIRLG